MTDKELFEKNLELSFEFSRYIIAHPEIGDELPPDSEVVFLVESNPELTQQNLKMAEIIKGEGKRVVFVRIKTILPKETCRLVEP
ncbi:MAG: DUF5647 family protein, partial [Candidatus Omnitrophota bacterium]